MSATIRDLLADEAIDAIGAASLGEARRCLSTQPIVGVVLDYTLPDGTADDLLDELASDAHAPGVVLASAHPRAGEAARRYRVPVIKKPLDLEELLAVVRSFIAGDAQPTPPRRVK